jgi:hypothetical protein
MKEVEITEVGTEKYYRVTNSTSMEKDLVIKTIKCNEMDRFDVVIYKADVELGNGLMLREKCGFHFLKNDKIYELSEEEALVYLI